MRRISSTEFPSESLPVMALLTVSGGLQDAYSYIERGHVFANAQTGNIVLLAVSAAEGRWNNVLSYAIPLAAFIIGIAIACFIRKLCGNSPRTIHWRQHVLLAEMILLASSAFIPNNHIANALISAACAMQVQSFRKVKGTSYASTMCIGNLRGGTEHLTLFIQTGNRENLSTALRYFLVITIFAIGAAIGSIAIRSMGQSTILISPVLLLIAFMMMIRKPQKPV